MKIKALTMCVMAVACVVSSSSAFANNTWRISAGDNVKLNIPANSKGQSVSQEESVRAKPTSCKDLAGQPDGVYAVYENGLDAAPVNRTCATLNEALGSGWTYVDQYYAKRGTIINGAQGDHTFSKVYVEFASNSSWISGWPDHRSSSQSNGVLVAETMHLMDRRLGTGYDGQTIVHDYGVVGNHPIEVWHWGRYKNLNWSNDSGSFRVNIYVK